MELWAQSLVESVDLIINLGGIGLCTILLFGTLLLGSTRTSVDILILGLGCGCLLRSLGGAIQNSLSLASMSTHQAVTMLLSLGVTLQFSFIIVIAWRNYLACSRGWSLPVRATHWVFALTLVGVGLGNGLTIAYSDETTPLFTSPTLLYWWTPLMLIGLISVIFCYISIYCNARESTQRVQREYVIRTPGLHRRHHTVMPLRVAKRSIMYIVIFVVSWIPLLVCVGFALTTGRVPGEAEITFLLCSSLHSIAVPIAYGWTNSRLRAALVNHSSCFAVLFPTHLIMQDMERKTRAVASARPSQHLRVPGQKVKRFTPTAFSTPTQLRPLAESVETKSVLVHAITM